MLTARIEGAVSDSGVTIKSPDHLPDNVSGGTREVDVSLRSNVGSAEVLVIVECRDRGRPADVTWLEQVKSKRDAVGASKAIAVASGNFSKKALAAASSYGIDARTLAEVSTAEIKRWAGAIQMFLQTVSYDNVKVSVRLAGPDPLPETIATRFDELIRARAFDAPFISYSDGLLSPLDVVRKIHPIREIPKGARVKITVPPKSSFMLSEDPTMMFLVGTPPADESAERHHTLSFDEGEALFSVDEFKRPLVAVHLDFTVRVESNTQVDSQAYRYKSSTGVIEVAEHVANVSGEPLIFTQHRQRGVDD